MGEQRRRQERHVTKNDPEKFAADVKRRREEAYRCDNFLIDVETGQVFFSSSKTAGGVALLKEESIAVPMQDFVQMFVSFLQLVVLNGAGVIPDGVMPNGNPE